MFQYSQARPSLFCNLFCNLSVGLSCFLERCVSMFMSRLHAVSSTIDHEFMCMQLAAHRKGVDMSPVSGIACKLMTGFATIDETARPRVS